MKHIFEDIKIVEMDENASYKSEPSTKMMHIIFILSESAPYDWAEYFNDRWKQNFYMMKRAAYVSGKRLEIYCVPEELQQYHIPQLKKVIAETNSAYRAHLEQTQRITAEREATEANERAKLADLKSQIKFD